MTTVCGNVLHSGRCEAGAGSGGRRCRSEPSGAGELLFSVFRQKERLVLNKRSVIILHHEHHQQLAALGFAGRVRTETTCPT